jgi:peroxiredoxin
MDNVNRVRVGHLAPDFALLDQDGQLIRLSDFQGKKNVLLFFYAGKRNPLCLDWLGELSLFYDEITKEEVEVLALSTDESWNSRQLKEEKRIRFSILKIDRGVETDQNSPLVSQRYSIETNRKGERSVYPAFFLVGRRGLILYRKAFTDATEKPDVEKLLSGLKELL